MNAIAISEFRSNLSTYLDDVKLSKKPIVFGSRHKKEFLVLPYPQLNREEDLFDIYDSLEDKVIQTEYYNGIENNMKDWLDEENDDLFK